MAANSWEAVLAAWPPRLRDAFLNAIYAIRDEAQIALIVDRLEAGDVDGAVRAAGVDPLDFADFEQEVADAYRAGGQFTAQAIRPAVLPGGFRLAVVFDIHNPRAEAYLKQDSSQRVTEIVADQQEAIRNHLTAGMEAGQNPKTVALDLVGRISPVTKRREGGVIGLTSAQEAWVRNYRTELETGDYAAAQARALHDKRFSRGLDKAAQDGKPISQDRINKMVTAYKNRALRYRGETIGRTEALTSLHAGQNEGMQQAIDAGQVLAGDVTKIWRSTMDSRVRESHRELNGTSVPFFDAFTSPVTGAQLMYPGDPSGPASEIINCRCYLEQHIDYLRKIREANG